MKRWWIMKGVKIGIMFLIFGILFTYVVMSLWNWLMPPLFSIGTITFWQALGIIILAKILFGFGRGGWGHRGYYGHHWKYGAPMWRQKIEEKLKNMTPEERERFREEWKRRCGRWGQYPFEEEKKDEPEIKTN